MRTLLLVSLVAALLALPSPARASSRVALVIGNSDYEQAPLQNPANDATDIATTLIELGFEVNLLKNGDRSQMERAINAFGKNLRGAEIGLFYFAGHGAEVEGINYLFPLHAGIDSEADVKYRTVDSRYVLAEMEGAGPRSSIIILDACRNNPFVRKFRSANRGLAIMDAPLGSVVAFATSPGKLASDGQGRNGVYTKYLLKHLRDPKLSIREILLKTRIDVVAETARRQIPWDASSLLAEVYLGAPVSDADRPVPSVPASDEIKDNQTMVFNRTTWTEPTTGMEFVWVPAGCFTMGEDRLMGDNSPAHKVCLDGFWIGKYEVTQRQWTTVMDSDSFYNKGLGKPADGISWEQAMEFVRRLGETGSGKYSLPTEAQWEYAAAGGANPDQDVTVYRDVAWYHSNSKDGSHEVGTKAPNALGLHDMSGNVWEWCRDDYDSSAYEKHDPNNPEVREDSRLKVIRGGGYMSQVRDLNIRSRDRMAKSQGARQSSITSKLGERRGHDYHLSSQFSDVIGFRVVRMDQ
ncbi:SUMF1/EgtB/PvdO family nonheme iron enzyme [Pseudodesulfovibrio indicus]|uniref:SUMF1/EgtB/PvdO family nonheme iron enzyme n=1 Tax=Pseudodesulfovibrio indicus TaxID=1716143 RepID=UPI00292F526F|nr:SUMF1/EgtB/PvdO family nonheme iron enzyme [Pseudodesulfovibrio indicus]